MVSGKYSITVSAIEDYQKIEVKQKKRLGSQNSF
jgi:hypothetical protein